MCSLPSQAKQQVTGLEPVQFDLPAGTVLLNRPPPIEYKAFLPSVGCMVPLASWEVMLCS